MASKKFINRKTATSRAQFNTWSNLIKSGNDPNRAMSTTRIENLESTISRSEFYESDSEFSSSDDVIVLESRTTETTSSGRCQGENIDQFLQRLISECHEDQMRSQDIVTGELESKSEKSESCFEGDDNCSGKSKADGRLLDEETLIWIEKTLNTNSLDDTIVWLLEEAEHCSHTLLLASGNVLVTQFGEVDKSFLWNSPSHESLFTAKDPIISALNRLTGALKSLTLLLQTPFVRSNSSWKQRFSNIMAIISAAKYDEKIDLDLISTSNASEFPTSTVEIESFYDVLSDDKGTQELYVLQHGLPGYMSSMQRLLDKSTGNCWKLNILDALKGASSMMCDYDQVRGMVGNLLAAKQITDIRVGNAFAALLRSAFHNLKFNDKKRIMQYFYDTYGTPLWQMMDSDLETNLTLAINKLCAQTKSKEYIQQLANEFAWFFMISLKLAWWQILKAVLRMPVIIPIIVEILRQLEPVTSVQYEGSGHRLILIGIRRLVDEKEIETEEHEANWIRFICALLSTKSWLANPKRQKTMSAVEPIVEKTEVVSIVVLPLLESNPRLAVRLLLAVLDDGVDGEIKWSNTESDQDGISASRMFRTIVDMYTKAKKPGADQNATMAKLSLETLRLLIAIWKSARVVLPAKDVIMLGRRYEALPWSIRCLVFGHLNKLAKTPIPIPVSRCLMDVLHLPEADYRCVDCDDWSENHSKSICWLTDLFQMASVSMEMAERILKRADVGELVESLKRGRLEEPIMEAYGRVLAEAQTLQEWRSSTDLFTTMYDRLKEEMEKCEPAYMKSYSRGTRVVAPVLRLCESVSRLIIKTPAATGICIRNFAIIANELITERIQSLAADPLSKFVAWESLFVNICALVATAKQISPEINILLVEIVGKLGKEHLRMDVVKTAAESIPECAEKEMLVKKLEEVC